MKISLCMIVKNEEGTLQKCLENIKDFVSEIIVVDTGSTDRTKDIAKQFTDRVYDFKWCNDFSKARNFSIQKSTNDWILILDADELIINFDKEQLARLIEMNDLLVGRIKRINILEDSNGIRKYVERVNRLFNRKYYIYEGIIHEQIVSKDKSDYVTTDIEVVADHIGYTKEVIRKTGKIKRNMDLLIKNIKDNDKDPYLYYQLGKTYYLDKNYEEACNSFCKALELDINVRYEYVEDLIETYGYSLVNTRKYSRALEELEKYKGYYNDVADYRFLMAVIYMNNGKFKEAVKEFLDCTKKKEVKMEGVNTYLAYYNIGVIYECLGLFEEAVYYYDKCEDYNLALKRIYNIKNNLAKNS